MLRFTLTAGMDNSPGCHGNDALEWGYLPIFAELSSPCMVVFTSQLQRRYRIESSGASFTMSSLSKPLGGQMGRKIKWQEETSFMTLTY